jgi:hypothetical protein
MRNKQTISLHLTIFIFMNSRPTQQISVEKSRQKSLECEGKSDLVEALHSATREARWLIRTARVILCNHPCCRPLF